MSGAPSRVFLVLPAYDEAENLPPLFAGIGRVAADLDVPLSVILVDDGSTDGTAAVAGRVGAELDLTVLVNEANAGLGATFARGMKVAAERAAEGDVIVCMDADDSHLPEQIPALLVAMDAGYDLVVVSRFRRGAQIHGVPWRRRGLALGMSLLFRAVQPVPGVRDYSTSFRAYRAGTIQAALAEEGDALFDTAGFGCMVSLLLELSARGARCTEIPITLRYDRKRGASKMRILPTMTHTLRVLAEARLGGRRGTAAAEARSPGTGAGGPPGAAAAHGAPEGAHRSTDDDREAAG